MSGVGSTMWLDAPATITGTSRALLGHIMSTSWHSLGHVNWPKGGHSAMLSAFLTPVDHPAPLRWTLRQCWVPPRGASAPYTKPCHAPLASSQAPCLMPRPRLPAHLSLAGSCLPLGSRSAGPRSHQRVHQGRDASAGRRPQAGKDQWAHHAAAWAQEPVEPAAAQAGRELHQRHQGRQVSEYRHGGSVGADVYWVHTCPSMYGMHIYGVYGAYGMDVVYRVCSAHGVYVVSGL